MELPRRTRGDELLKPGELTAVRERLRLRAREHDLSSVIACAFDHRTRMLPFIFADTRMIPAGVRAIGSALADSGFARTRIVLQQWNRNFRPSQMRLDGRIPDLFMVSSMSLHSGPCMELIRDAHRIDAGAAPADHRRRTPRRLRAVRPLQCRSRTPGERRCRRHGRGIRAALPHRGGVVGARSRRTAALRIRSRARKRGARRHSRPRLFARNPGRHSGGTRRHRHSAPRRRSRRAAAPRARLPADGAARPARHAQRAGDAGRGGAPTKPHRFARADLRLQIRLPLLPDSRLQPAAVPREERRADRRRDVSAQQGLWDPLLLRRGRQLLQRQGAHARHRADAGPGGIRRQDSCAAASAGSRR